MFLHRKKYPSGRTGIIVAEKVCGRICELCTIGVSDDPAELEVLLAKGREWIDREDAYNREKGIRRLEKAYRSGALTKGNINRSGYNKFLTMEGEVEVSINRDRILEDAR